MHGTKKNIKICDNIWSTGILSGPSYYVSRVSAYTDTNVCIHNPENM